MGLVTNLHDKRSHSAKAALVRQATIFTLYLDWLAAHPAPDLAQRTVSVLARSPASPVVQAVIAHRDAFTARDVKVQAIVAFPDPEPGLRAMCDTLLELAPERRPQDLMRWAVRGALHDAHEQAILGTTMCWSGDMLRREPGKRDALDLFQSDAAEPVRRGMMAFDAFWSAAADVPNAWLVGPCERKPTGSYAEPAADALARPIPLNRKATPDLVSH